MIRHAWLFLEHGQQSATAFAACAPCLWNSLPSHLRSANSLYTFKKHLKTYIFKQTFNV